MAYERRDGDGSLFKNDRKETDKHPDYQGSILINGEDFWLSAWIKKGAKGTFMSLSAKPKQERAQEIVQRSRHDDDLDTDTIPF
jgi:hypothetical protein